ncbi:hypothetical protein B0T14DRAFT_539968 [Immersiella caudata]|uniref:Zn(2)-C6 fungal-type domain-containing protein n=1 Tax=Immersiella caudata TaxID=314043 RepID=A0AA40BUW7_9PEZI|nr:hypothetical protein B0T14DRAFT_539968 [Immersiella caudata]
MTCPSLESGRPASTCITCRARKVRCDGRRDVCANCERLGFGCSYDDSAGGEPDSPGVAPGPAVAVPRRRVRQACLNCHAKKARCSGSMPQCDRCRTQGLDCVYRPGKRSLPLPGIAVGVGSQDVVMQDDGEQSASYDHSAFTHGSASPVGGGFELPEPGEALAMRVFDAFFRHVHHIPMFCFLHRASLMDRYHAGTLDRALLLAMIGITALLTDLGPGMDEYGERCIEESAALCLAELEKLSILRLQALVIVVKHRILSKKFASAFMLHAVASRFASALRLNHESPNLCFLARESRRRLMWSIYMIDSSLAAGQPDFALWGDAERQIHIQLPCNERHFEFDLPETTELLRPPPPDHEGIAPPLPDVVGFIALHVRIHWMRTKILQLSTKLATAPSLEDIAALPGQCADLASQLEAFEARLPLSFRWSEANLRLRTYSPRLGIFVMTHVWWRQCYLDLYRLFLSGLKEALPPVALAQLDPHFVAQCRRSCYEHAKAMADMFAQLLTLGNGTPVTDIDLPGCAFQCSRMLYHGLQTAADEMGFTLEGVQELASVCLRAAKQCTAGSACASIQADIDKLIREGLELVIPDPSQIPNLPLPHTSDDMPTSQAFILPDPASLPTSLPPDISTSIPVTAALSNVSGDTSGSNAFEETVGGFNFVPELQPVPDASWMAFSLSSNDWLDMGHLPPPESS